MGWVKGGVLLSADVKNKNSFDRLPTVLFRGPHNETSPRLVIGLPAMLSGFSWTLVHNIRYAMHN